MGDRGRSDRGISGGYNHYDSQGRKTGHSDMTFFGDLQHYDNSGHRTGRSERGLFGGVDHYDAQGHKTGHSEPSLFGGMDHYDNKGRKIGHSEQGLFRDYSHSSEGCYVATCVYGSYDCPQVWTLRRFRDTVLKKSTAGRLFIHIYYAASPRIVARFGQRSWFTGFWRRRLDRVVIRLHRKGFADTPYCDGIIARKGE